MSTLKKMTFLVLVALMLGSTSGCVKYGCPANSEAKLDPARNKGKRTKTKSGLYDPKRAKKRRKTKR